MLFIEEYILRCIPVEDDLEFTASGGKELSDQAI